MRGDDRLINIQYRDGAVKRLPRSKAEVQVELGRAKYISNTLYKAALHGVEVKEGLTDTEVKALIANRNKPEKKSNPEKGKQPRNKRGKRNGS